jgi:hypothetical protein
MHGQVFTSLSFLPARLNQSFLMKKITTFAICVVTLLGMYACNNSLDKVFDDQTLVEFNEAVLRANAVGRSFSITALNNTAAVAITTTAQVNLVGPQRSSDLTVRVLVDPAYTTAAASSYSLVNGGNVTIPANSSFGSLTLVTARASSTTAPVANVVVILDSTAAEFKPSFNYRRLGFSVRQ